MSPASESPASDVRLNTERIEAGTEAFLNHRGANPKCSNGPYPYCDHTAGEVMADVLAAADAASWNDTERLRAFVDDALSKLPEAHALAATKHGSLKAYADGVNAGIEEALLQVKNALAESVPSPPAKATR